MTVLHKGSEIAEYLTEVLSEIRIANGYHTDIGARVLRGRRKVDESFMPCVVLIEGDDNVLTDPEKVISQVVLIQEYVIGGYDVCDSDNPNDKGHLIAKDIKKALWNRNTQKTNLGGRVQRFTYRGKNIGPRADGEPFIFTVVHAEAKFAETLDDS